jgi:acyl-CoA reductase-like NAD-dependent aldehyde dehydrogenase
MLYGVVRPLGTKGSTARALDRINGEYLVHEIDSRAWAGRPLRLQVSGHLCRRVFRWLSEEAVRTEGAYGVSPAGGTRSVATHRPVGVAALVTSWNFPAAMATRMTARS